MFHQAYVPPYLCSIMPLLSLIFPFLCWHLSMYSAMSVDQFVCIPPRVCVFTFIYIPPYLCFSLTIFHRVCVPAYGPSCLCFSLSLFHRAFIPVCLDLSPRLCSGISMSLSSNVSMFRRPHVPTCLYMFCCACVSACLCFTMSEVYRRVCFQQLWYSIVSVVQRVLVS